MAKTKRKPLRRKRVVKGRGLVSSALSGVSNIAGTVLNKGIDLLPIELHLPGGYRYCGPGTRLQERLARGDKGINGLDEACKAHDISYSRYKDSENRRIADKLLAKQAWQRFKASDSSLGEKTAALAVTAAMKAKSKLGGGRRTKQGSGRRKKRQTKRKQPTRGKGLYLRPYTEGSGRKKKRRVNKKKACQFR